MSAHVTVLPYRDALSDWDHVGSDVLFSGSGAATPPLVSIMIPTFGRSELLADTVRSALAQDLTDPLEVVVIDNDPQSDGCAALLSAVPATCDANFRYLRNRQNLGADGNANRCVTQARGEWISILHDDDLLDRGFARLMLAQLRSNPRFDGLICRKRGLDQREERTSVSRVARISRSVRDVVQFRGRRVRRVDARKLFWGCIIGNTVGFICRVQHMRAVGGFYKEEYPSADYFFYVRYSNRYLLGETKEVLATIRVLVNSLIRPEVLLACLRRSREIQDALAGGPLPRFWHRLTPLVMARQVAVMTGYWRSPVSKADAEVAIGLALPRDRPRLLYAMRLALRGF